MLYTVFSAILAFVSTNMDDLFVLTIFLSQMHSSTPRYGVLIGEYLGIGILFFISSLGALGLSMLPRAYTGLLGFVPIWFGAKVWLDAKKGSEPKQESAVKKAAPSPAKKSGADGAVFQGLIKMTLLTVAGGADNIGIYTPFFGGMDAFSWFLTLLAFIPMIALWYSLAGFLADRPAIKKSMQKYKAVAVPLIFLGLGIHILAASGGAALLLDWAAGFFSRKL